ncbi:MAG: LysR family transcriptional regulator [Elusimicrobia bacterium]|nr:LysR family transcriptional regulator [Elusimicrobiota bacterium]
MLPFNYHHLYYFWVTAKAGRISGACRQLLLSQSTLSMQILQLERSFGRKLLHRSRRGVELTSEGRIAFDYCERIFSQGDELAAAMRPEQAGAAPSLRLGVAEAISRRVVVQLLDVIHRMDRLIKVSIVGGTPDDLRARLEKHRLDLVLSNVEMATQLGVEFRSRLAGSVPFHFVAAPQIARRVRRFPADLATVPMLMRSPDNPVRKEVDLFLCRHKVRVSVDVEIGEADLLQTLALRGQGVAALDALAIREDVARRRLAVVNRRPVAIREHLWLVAGRHPKPNPALHAVLEHLMETFQVRI